MTAPSLAERLEAEMGYWPRTSTLHAVLTEAAALARRVEGAVHVEWNHRAGIVAPHWYGKRVAIVQAEGGADGRG